MCAKRFIEHFSGLSLSTRSIGHNLFDTDDLTALRALAETMTGGSISSLGPSQPTAVSSGFFILPSFPRDRRFGPPVNPVVDYFRFLPGENGVCDAIASRTAVSGASRLRSLHARIEEQ